MTVLPWGERVHGGGDVARRVTAFFFLVTLVENFACYKYDYKFQLYDSWRAKLQRGRAFGVL
jgi:hypothetical protein